MRIKTMLQTTAVLGLAVVAGLLGVSGTWALWNATATDQPGTVQAASFDMKLSGPTGASGNLTPEQPVYSTFTVTNETNASGEFRIEAVADTQGIGSSDPELTEYLLVETTAMPASESCIAAPYGTEASAEVGKNDSVDFCVRFTLEDGAPEEISDSTSNVTIPVTALQIKPTPST